MNFIQRWIDWKMVAAITAMAVVALVGHSSLEAGQERDQANRDKAVLIARLQDQEKAATKQRAELIREQRALRANYEELLTYLQHEGIEVPPSLIDPIVRRSSTTRIVERDSDGSDSDSDSKSGGSSSTRNPEPGNSGSTGGGGDSPSGGGSKS